jgi:deoxycytidylate deaminase
MPTEGRGVQGPTGAFPGTGLSEPPKREEHAMFMAYASAARCAQLGHQVGAVIATPEGEVIAPQRCQSRKSQACKPA